MQEIYPESSFPLLIEYTESDPVERKVVSTPEELENGHSFKVLETNYLDWKELGKPFDSLDDIPREHLIKTLRIADLLVKCAVCGRYTLKQLHIHEVCTECAIGATQHNPSES